MSLDSSLTPIQLWTFHSSQYSQQLWQPNPSSKTQSHSYIPFRQSIVQREALLQKLNCELNTSLMAESNSSLLWSHFSIILSEFPLLSPNPTVSMIAPTSSNNRPNTIVLSRGEAFKKAELNSNKTIHKSILIKIIWEVLSGITIS